MIPADGLNGSPRAPSPRTKNSAKPKRVRYKSKARSKRGEQKAMAQANNSLMAVKMKFMPHTFNFRRFRGAAAKKNRSVQINRIDLWKPIRCRCSATRCDDCCRQHANVAALLFIKHTKKTETDADKVSWSQRRTNEAANVTHKNG